MLRSIIQFSVHRATLVRSSPNISSRRVLLLARCRTTASQIQHTCIAGIQKSPSYAASRSHNSQPNISSTIRKHRRSNLLSSSGSLSIQTRKTTKSALDSEVAPAPLEYKAPTSGLLYYLPRSWVPYAELIRLDKPVGTYYLFFPCLFSTLLAAPLTDPITTPSTVMGTTLLFLTGALVMRGAGCTINDLWDRNLDPHVSRTRLRPIARKAITPLSALVFTGAQLLTGLAVLLQFPLPCFYYATPSLLLVATYPLAKRVTHYPQFVLGLTFSWGAFMGFPALGIDLLSHTSAALAAGCLYASNIAWTVLYDMIYAHQDIRDDKKAGIKSIARRHEENTKAVLSGLAVVQTGLLAAAGWAVGAGPVYFIGVCGSAAATTGTMIWRVDLKRPEDCWWWFRHGCWFTGGGVAAGLAAEYAAHYFDIYDKNEPEVS